MSTFIKLACVVSIALLSACGGGNSSAPAAAPVAKVVTSFPLLAGYKKRIANGFSTSYIISGDCSGLAFKKQGIPSIDRLGNPSLITDFEGAPALPTFGSTTIASSNCPPSQSEYVNFYDGNTFYSLLGHSLSSAGTTTTVASVEYGKLVSPTIPLPASVKINDSGTYGTEQIYLDDTKTATQGYDFLSYIIESDAPSKSTAIVNLITERYDTLSKDNLLFKQQSRYRIVEDGTLTDLSIDVQYSTTSTAHIVFTVP